jgi:hypothetical protein
MEYSCSELFRRSISLWARICCHPLQRGENPGAQVPIRIYMSSVSAFTRLMQSSTPTVQQPKCCKVDLNSRVSSCVVLLLVNPSALSSFSSHSLACFVVGLSIGLFIMFASWSLLAIPAVILLTTPVQAIDVKPYIGAVAELRTECKTCPRSLCPNQLYYDYEESLNVTCWTHGTKIMGDRLWMLRHAVRSD